MNEGWLLKMGLSLCQFFLIQSEHSIVYTSIGNVMTIKIHILYNHFLTIT